MGTGASENERAWESVLAHIEARLLSGDLGPGDRLPAERALAIELGVGRSSVREAVRVLEALGLIRTRTGSGPSSGAVIIARPTGGMSALMRLQVAASGFAVADIVRTRLVLETAVVDDLAAHLPSTANGATANGTIVNVAAPDLAAAHELLGAMDADDLAHDEFLAIDQRFHLALAEASGNAVITAMTAGLRDAVEGYVVAAARSLPSWETTRDRLRAEHRAIVAAIESGDAPEARRLVAAHITGYYAETHLDAAAVPPAPITTRPVITPPVITPPVITPPVTTPPVTTPSDTTPPVTASSVTTSSVTASSVTEPKV